MPGLRNRGRTDPLLVRTLVSAGKLLRQEEPEGAVYVRA